MPASEPPAQLHPQRRSPLSAIEDRRPEDATLAQCRREYDEATLRRIVNNEAAELLPKIHGVMKDVERLNSILAIAKLSGSSREDSIRLSLAKLAELASP